MKCNLASKVGLFSVGATAIGLGAYYGTRELVKSLLSSAIDLSGTVATFDFDLGTTSQNRLQDDPTPALHADIPSLKLGDGSVDFLADVAGKFAVSYAVIIYTCAVLLAYQLRQCYQQQRAERRSELSGLDDLALPLAPLGSSNTPSSRSGR